MPKAGRCSIRKVSRCGRWFATSGPAFWALWCSTPSRSTGCRRRRCALCCRNGSVTRRPRRSCRIPACRSCMRLAIGRSTVPPTTASRCRSGQFPTGDRYYATALHELGHATGHSSRLNRDLAHPFGSEGYAREELRAEIGSLMLGEQLGIGHDPGQHVAYVASWIKVLQQDPREVFRAAADAEKITALVRSYEQVQQQTADQTQQAVQVQVANEALEAEVESSSPPMVGGTLPWRQSGRDAAAEPVSPGNTDTGITGQGSTENVSSQPSDLQSVRMPTLIREHSPTMKPSSPERTYIAVPYAEKDAAKQLGAKWDRSEKSWYVPFGVELDAFAAWMPARGSVHIAVEVSPVEQFAQAIRECGLQLEGAPQMDGRIHRVPVIGEKGGKRSGAYSGHLDGRPAGFIQNHKTGVKQNWRRPGGPRHSVPRTGHRWPPSGAEATGSGTGARAAGGARGPAGRRTMDGSCTCPLASLPNWQEVQAHGLRQDADGELLVPVQDADVRIWSLRRIGNGRAGIRVGGNANRPGSKINVGQGSGSDRQGTWPGS
jgi:putative DNA primase/helicase